MTSHDRKTLFSFLFKAASWFFNSFFISETLKSSPEFQDLLITNEHSSLCLPHENNKCMRILLLTSRSKLVFEICCCSSYCCNIYTCTLRWFSFKFERTVRTVYGYAFFKVLVFISGKML